MPFSWTLQPSLEGPILPILSNSSFFNLPMGFILSSPWREVLQKSARECGEKQPWSKEGELVHPGHTARSQGPTAAQWVLELGDEVQPEATACILPANLQFPSFTGCDPHASDAHRAHRSMGPGLAQQLACRGEHCRASAKVFV